MATSKEMSNFKSSNTLRNSVIAHQFPKGERFRINHKPNPNTYL